jgi:hypothetical protein
MKTKVIFFLLMMAMGGCATIPTGPNVNVMPGPGKTFEEFEADCAVCRQWASQQMERSPQETVNWNTGVGAAVGTVAGAALGAAIGSAQGHAGTGAAIGAGSGLLIGTTAGANAGQTNGLEAQRRYDIAYQQCMYAKGNQNPGTEPSPPAPVAVSPAPPRFIYSPELGFYVAVERPDDLVFVDGQYFLWGNGYWHRSRHYNGPWAVVKAGRVPRNLHRFGYEKIRRFRDDEYRRFVRDREHYHGRWHVPEERRGHD